MKCLTEQQVQEYRTKLAIAKSLWSRQNTKCAFCCKRFGCVELWRVHSLMRHPVEYVQLEQQTKPFEDSCKLNGKAKPVTGRNESYISPKHTSKLKSKDSHLSDKPHTDLKNKRDNSRDFREPSKLSEKGKTAEKKRKVTKEHADGNEKKGQKEIEVVLVDSLPPSPVDPALDTAPQDSPLKLPPPPPPPSLTSTTVDNKIPIDKETRWKKLRKLVSEKSKCMRGGNRVTDLHRSLKPPTPAEPVYCAGDMLQDQTTSIQEDANSAAVAKPVKSSEKQEICQAEIEHSKWKWNSKSVARPEIVEFLVKRKHNSNLKRTAVHEVRTERQASRANTREGTAKSVVFKVTVPSKPSICESCNKKFPTRNELFIHLKKTGHRRTIDNVRRPRNSKNPRKSRQPLSPRPTRPRKRKMSHTLEDPIPTYYPNQGPAWCAGDSPPNIMAEKYAPAPHSQPGACTLSICTANVRSAMEGNSTASCEYLSDKQAQEYKTKLGIAKILWSAKNTKCAFCPERVDCVELWRIHCLMTHPVEYIQLEQLYRGKQTHVDKTKPVDKDDVTAGAKPVNVENESHTNISSNRQKLKANSKHSREQENLGNVVASACSDGPEVALSSDEEGEIICWNAQQSSKDVENGRNNEKKRKASNKEHGDEAEKRRKVGGSDVITVVDSSVPSPAVSVVATTPQTSPLRLPPPPAPPSLAPTTSVDSGIQMGKASRWKKVRKMVKRSCSRIVDRQWSLRPPAPSKPVHDPAHALLDPVTDDEDADSVGVTEPVNTGRDEETRRTEIETCAWPEIVQFLEKKKQTVSCNAEASPAQTCQLSSAKSTSAPAPLPTQLCDSREIPLPPPQQPPTPPPLPPTPAVATPPPPPPAVLEPSEAEARIQEAGAKVREMIKQVRFEKLCESVQQLKEAKAKAGFPVPTQSNALPASMAASTIAHPPPILYQKPTPAGYVGDSPPNEPGPPPQPSRPSSDFVLAPPQPVTLPPPQPMTLPPPQPMTLPPPQPMTLPPPQPTSLNLSSFICSPLVRRCVHVPMFPCSKVVGSAYCNDRTCLYIHPFCTCLDPVCPLEHALMIKYCDQCFLASSLDANPFPMMYI